MGFAKDAVEGYVRTLVVKQSLWLPVLDWKKECVVWGRV